MIAQCNVKLEPQLKEDAQQLFKSLGISMSTALTLYLRACVRAGGIPFPLTTGPTPETEITE